MNFDFKILDFNDLTSCSVFYKEVEKFLQDWESGIPTVLVQTSGSTGMPKKIEVEKKKMLNSAKMTCDFLDLKKGNTALLCLPMAYISGKMMVVRALERQMSLLISEPKINPIEHLTESVDFCAMTPLQVENSLDKIHLIKKLIIGGAAVSESLKQKIFEAMGRTQSRNCIFETYGMSETLSHIALKKIYSPEQEFFTILDKVEISQDERGCLVINAPLLNDGILKTNDLVEMKSEREFSFLGRIDNVINSGGAKIFPEKLEVLVKKEISNEVVFIGVADEVLGEKLVLIIEGNEDKNLIQKIKNINFEKSFYQPKEIIFIEKIPRTPNGKVDRMALK